MILNRAKDYYENNKELLRERERERAKNKYRELSEEEKNTKREYGKIRYHSMSEEKKKRLKNNFANADMSIKVHYKIAIAKIFLVPSFINF